MEIMQKRKTTLDNVGLPTPQKEKNLVKPDFSPIFEKENQIDYKIYGSYKKPRFIEPESPFKSPNYKTPAKIECKNLFGTKPKNPYSRKLNFDDIGDENTNFSEKANRKNSGAFSGNKIDNLLKGIDEDDESQEYEGLLPSPKFGHNNEYGKEEVREEEHLKNNKMENDFNEIKTMKIDKFNRIYKVEDKKTKKIYSIKKIFKKSPKNNIKTIKNIFKDFQNNKNNIGSEFCVNYIDFWIQKEEYDLETSELNFCEESFYILYDYYEYGDLFDYLEKLEKNNFKFSEDFYWDIVFEMIVGLLYLHNCGYLHLDVQPSNYLVDGKGYVKLNDFSISHKIEELSKLDDILEGDSRYISKEAFHFKSDNKDNKLTTKCDVFSLGLSFLEIISKMNLPYNGPLWHEFRDDNFTLPKDCMDKSNIKNTQNFIKLISKMISPFDKRPELKQLIKETPHLAYRYELLLKKQYKKSSTIPAMKDLEKPSLEIKYASSSECL